MPIIVTLFAILKYLYLMFKTFCQILGKIIERAIDRIEFIYKEICISFLRYLWSKVQMSF